MALFGRLNEAAERVTREHMNPAIRPGRAAGGRIRRPGDAPPRSGAPYILSPTPAL